MLDNTQNTFVTPVFNGSASLRNAAGQLIEDTNKSVKRGGAFDDAYVDRLFEEVTSLYRLDQISGGGLGDVQLDLGKLPTTAVILLCSIAGTWVLIGVYVVYNYIKKRKR